MKITPIMLFFLILIVLVISIVIGNNLIGKEGFISFQYSTKPVDAVALPCYSTTKMVTKIEDNFYFDKSNGNLIEIDGSAYANTSDTKGTTITKLYVTPRTADHMYTYNIDTSSGTVPVVQDTDVSTITSMINSYSSYIMKNIASSGQNSTVVYIPWLKQTYIIPVLWNNPVSVSNIYFFNYGDNAETGIIPTNSNLNITGFVQDDDTNNNKTVAEPLYDATRSIYQISKYVKFDSKNGNLILLSSNETNNTVTVYDRYKNVVPTPLESANNTTTIPNVSFQPWAVLDTTGQNIVLYLPNEQTTVIALICFHDNLMSNLGLRNVVRFKMNGADTGKSNIDNQQTQNWQSIPAPAPAPAPASSNTTGTCGTKGTSGTTGTKTQEASYGSFGKTAPLSTPNAPQHDSVISEYFKWYWYWKSGTGASSSPEQNSDYILKTQIIPPVCPGCSSCPSCQNSGDGTCTNCGGKGGSGTLTTSGTSIFDASGNQTTCEKLGPNKIGYDASKNKILCYQPKSTGSSSSYGSGSSSSYGSGSSSSYGSGSSSSYGSGSSKTHGSSSSSSKNNTHNQGQWGSNSAGGVINNAISTTGGVIGGTAMGAEAVVGETVSGAGRLVNNVIDKTSGLISGAGHGVSNLLTNSQGGNNQSGYNQSGNNQSGYNQSGNKQSGYKQSGNNQRSSYYGTQNQYMDEYSYNGQLPSKGASNFMPITTDFSAFGR
jgi:hypothetical protein